MNLGSPRAKDAFAMFRRQQWKKARKEKEKARQEREHVAHLRGLRLAKEAADKKAAEEAAAEKAAAKNKKPSRLAQAHRHT